MPGTTADTGSFIYQSVLVSSGVDYVIDKSTYTNMITATAGTLSIVSITPTSKVANSVTTYTITFNNTHEIVQNGQIVVAFPSEITMSNPTQSANQCTRISGIGSSFVCTVTTSTVTVTGGFSSGSLAANSVVSFSIGSVTNPVSLQPSSTFSISTQTSANDYIDVVTSGVTVTMTSVNEITSASLSPASLINGAVTNIEFSIVASSPLQNNYKLLVTYPTEVTAPSGTIT